MVKIVAQHKVNKWDESTIHDYSERNQKLTRVSAVFGLDGGLVGEATVEYTMFYLNSGASNPHDAHATYSGYIHFVGRVGDEEGGFSMADTGCFQNGAATSQLTIVKGSGTGSFLSGVEGTGWYKASADGYVFELDLNPASMTQKETAEAFLRGVIRSDLIDHAYSTYLTPDFKHHNPYFRSDAASLKAGMASSNTSHPNKTLAVQRVVEEGKLVTVHSRVTLTQDEPTDIAVVHIFRFEDGKIAELWDVSMLLKAETENEAGSF